MKCQQIALIQVRLAISKLLDIDGIESDLEELADRIDELESAVATIEFHLFGTDGICALEAGDKDEMT